MGSSRVLVMILGMRERRGHAPIGTPRIVRLRHDACSWPYVFELEATLQARFVSMATCTMLRISKTCRGIPLI